MKLLGTHHVAVISSNYAISKRFYTEILKLEFLFDFLVCVRPAGEF